MKLWYLLDEACTKTVSTCHGFVRICSEVDWSLTQGNKPREYLSSLNQCHALQCTINGHIIATFLLLDLVTVCSTPALLTS